MTIATSTSARTGLQRPRMSLTASTRMTRGILVLIIAAAGVVGVLATDPGATVQAVAMAGGDLTRLLRGMAAIKAFVAAGVAWAVLWRLGSAISGARLAAYALACAAMAAGPGFIWDMAHIAIGAALLHGGLLATLVLLWRDPAAAARLSAAVAACRSRTPP